MRQIEEKWPNWRTSKGGTIKQRSFSPTSLIELYVLQPSKSPVSTRATDLLKVYVAQYIIRETRQRN